MFTDSEIDTLYNNLVEKNLALINVYDNVLKTCNSIIKKTELIDKNLDLQIRVLKIEDAISEMQRKIVEKESHVPIHIKRRKLSYKRPEPIDVTSCADSISVTSDYNYPNPPPPPSINSRTAYRLGTDVNNLPYFDESYEDYHKRIFNSVPNYSFHPGENSQYNGNLYSEFDKIENKDVGECMCMFNTPPKQIKSDKNPQPPPAPRKIQKVSFKDDKVFTDLFSNPPYIN